jgi:hypothetical protein
MGHLMRKIKPKPKLKKPARRVRRSPYGRALELATKRYEKAIAEYIKCQTRMAALEQEIPSLDEVKRVLEGHMHGGKPTAPALNPLPVRESPRPPAPPVELPAAVISRVPPHLLRYITPHPSIARGSQAQGSVVKTNLPGGDDDDRFLPEPGGVEVLP